MNPNAGNRCSFLVFQMMCHNATVHQWIFEALFLKSLKRVLTMFVRDGCLASLPSEGRRWSSGDQKTPLDRMAMRSWWPARSLSWVCIVLLVSVRDAWQHEGSSSIKFHVLFLWCHLGGDFGCRCLDGFFGEVCVRATQKARVDGFSASFAKLK